MSQPGWNGRPVRILYVDDSLFDRELVRDSLVLEHGGFLVVEASSRGEFESLLASESFDLVLSDFHVRGFGGLDVIEMVRQRDPNIPVIIVTGTGSEQEAVEAMKLGAADYVLKTPDHILRLPRTIFSALERRRLREEHIRAEVAQRFMVEASAVLASSLDYESTLGRLVHLAAPGLADFCLIHVVDDKVVGGVMTASLDATGQKATHESWRRRGPTSDWQGVVRSAVGGEFPVILQSIPEQLLPLVAHSTDQLSLLKSLALQSVILAPLLAPSRRMGLLVLGRLGAGNPFLPDDLTLASELAGRIALAVDNACLYRDAQDAIRVRDEFLAIAAHELKTPITSLKGFAQLTSRLIEKDGQVDVSQVRQAMNVINQQSDKLNHMMSRLLDISRIESRRLSLELTVVDLTQVAREVVEKIRVSSGRTVAFEAPESVPGLMDAIRLEQVLTNLLDNAVKYSPDTAPIEVQLSVPSPDSVCVSVRDHGVGIP
ncbi:MAG TPA: response regulator, partial [Chloroflexota bacterium]